MARVPKFRFPAGQTWDYFTDVRDLLSKIHENTIDKFERQIIPVSRSDSYAAENEIKKINITLDTLRTETFEFIFTPEVIQQVTSKFVESVKNHTAVQFGRQYKAILGIDPIGRDSRFLGIAEAAVKENVSYIKSIPSNYHDRVETVILQGVRRGQSVKQITDELQHVYDISRDKAKFIARDQAGSLTADMTKARHEAAGLEYFIWSTTGDDAVRDAHKAFNGLRFKWSKGAGIDGLLPGEDFGCRCVPEIDEEELLNQ